MAETVKYDVEVTDTFGGQANYSWVNRTTIEVPADISQRALVRRAKAAVGIAGRHRTTAYSAEDIRVDFVGRCVVMFITWNGYGHD